MWKHLMLAAIATAGCAGGASAGMVTGSKTLTDIGSTTTNTGSIFSATRFNFGAPVAAAGGTVDFGSYASSVYFVTATALDLANPTTFKIGSAALGYFTASTVSVDSLGATTKGFYVLGTFAPGTDFPVGLRDAGPASLSIGFTQVSPTSTVSVSATLQSPPLHSPEPGTLAAAATGAVGLAFTRLRRRKV